MIAIILRSLKDLLDHRILLISLSSLIIAGAILGGVFYLFHTQVNDIFAHIASYIPFVSKDAVKLATESILGLFIFTQLWVVVALTVVSVFADSIVDRVNSKYYHLPKNGFGSIGGSIKTSLLANLKYIILFILLSPLLFIPVVNILVQIFLWSIMIKDPIYYDAAAFYLGKNEFRDIKVKYSFEFRVITLLASLLLFIPFIGVFGYVLQLIIFTHFALSKLSKRSR
jgi:hypothetical protein